MRGANKRIQPGGIDVGHAVFLQHFYDFVTTVSNGHGGCIDGRLGDGGGFLVLGSGLLCGIGGLARLGLLLHRGGGLGGRGVCVGVTKGEIHIAGNIAEAVSTTSIDVEAILLQRRDLTQPAL